MISGNMQELKVISLFLGPHGNQFRYPVVVLLLPSCQPTVQCDEVVAATDKVPNLNRSRLYAAIEFEIE